MLLQRLFDLELCCEVA